MNKNKKSTEVLFLIYVKAKNLISFLLSYFPTNENIIFHLTHRVTKITFRNILNKSSAWLATALDELWPSSTSPFLTLPLAFWPVCIGLMASINLFLCLLARFFFPLNNFLYVYKRYMDTHELSRGFRYFKWQLSGKVIC